MNRQERQYLASVLEQNAQLRKRLDARTNQMLVLLEHIEVLTEVIDALGFTVNISDQVLNPS